MRRPTQFIRFVGLFALILAASHGGVGTAESMKGFRAIIFSGETLREPVRVGDFETATELYLRLMRGTAMPDSAGVVEGRRCIIVSAFLANEANMNTPLEALPPGGGRFNYQLYVFERGVRPVMKAKNYLWRVTPEVAEEISALGVPVSDTTRTAPGCK